MGRVAAYVDVTDEEGRRVWLRPGDEVPDWAVDQLPNPKVWEGGELPAPPKAAPPADDGMLKGKALEDALAARGLPSAGSADEKRQAVADFDALDAVSADKLRDAYPDETADVPASAHKGELVRALVDAGVDPPAEA